MSKIEYTYKDKAYTLEYDRASIARMEKVYGVNLEAVRTMQISVFTDLFSGAFIKNHPDVDEELISEMYDLMPNKTELIEDLARMYIESVNTLLADPPKGKAIAWKKL